MLRLIWNSENLHCTLGSHPCYSANYSQEVSTDNYPGHLMEDETVRVKQHKDWHRIIPVQHPISEKC